MSRNRHPIDILQMMADDVTPEDGCVKCGYQFGYSEEGCEDCEVITVVLEAAGKTFGNDD